QQSSGNIWVYSEPQHGTTFKVYFPINDAVQRAPEDDRRASGTSLGTETILLVDDEPLVRNVARRVLERAGHRVLEAAGAQEAEDVARRYKGSIDLLLTDVVLAGGHGGEVGERLRALRPGLKVLFMSGYTGNIIADRRMLDPGTLLLEKPFTPE